MSTSLFSSIEQIVDSELIFSPSLSLFRQIFSLSITAVAALCLTDRPSANNAQIGFPPFLYCDPESSSTQIRMHTQTRRLDYSFTRDSLSFIPPSQIDRHGISFIATRVWGSIDNQILFQCSSFLSRATNTIIAVAIFTRKYRKPDKMNR